MEPGYFLRLGIFCVVTRLALETCTQLFYLNLWFLNTSINIYPQCVCWRRRYRRDVGSHVESKNTCMRYLWSAQFDANCGHRALSVLRYHRLLSELRVLLLQLTNFNTNTTQAFLMRENVKLFISFNQTPAHRSTPTPSLPPSLSPHPYFPIDDSPAVGMAALEPLLPLRSSRGWWWLSVLLEEKQDSVS